MVGESPPTIEFGRNLNDGRIDVESAKLERPRRKVITYDRAAPT